MDTDGSRLAHSAPLSVAEAHTGTNDDQSVVVNALIEMTRLWTRRPSAGTPVDAAAAWYRAKGLLLEQLAAGGDCDATGTVAHAAVAYARARMLVGSESTPA